MPFVTLSSRLTAGDLSIQVNLNDYLDVYCPHFTNKETLGPRQPETLALYLVGEASFQGCVETRGAIKRWECNTPYAPFGPVRFSEKIQRFTPFSLGFEFLPGHHYYYSCKCKKINRKVISTWSIWQLAGFWFPDFHVTHFWRLGLQITSDNRPIIRLRESEGIIEMTIVISLMPKMTTSPVSQIFKYFQYSITWQRSKFLQSRRWN